MTKYFLLVISLLWSVTAFTREEPESSQLKKPPLISSLERLSKAPRMLSELNLEGKFKLTNTIVKEESLMPLISQFSLQLMKDWTHLKSLNLANNQLRGTKIVTDLGTALLNLPNLTSLNLAFNGFKGEEVAALLSSLPATIKEIDLTGNNIKSIPGGFNPDWSLTTFKLSNNPLVFGSKEYPWAKFKNYKVEHLYLENLPVKNNLTHKLWNWPHLSSAKNVYLNNTPLNGLNMLSFLKNSVLKQSFYLQNTELDDVFFMGLLLRLEQYRKEHPEQGDLPPRLDELFKTETTLKYPLIRYDLDRNKGITEKSHALLFEKTIQATLPSNFLIKLPGSESSLLDSGSLKRSMTLDNLYELPPLIDTIPDSPVSRRETK